MRCGPSMTPWSRNTPTLRNCRTKWTPGSAEIETALAAFDERPVAYDPAEIARAGVFVSIDADGGLRIERGYVRREDEAPVEPVEGGAVAGTDPPPAMDRTQPGRREAHGSSSVSSAATLPPSCKAMRRKTMASSRCRNGW